MKCPKCHTENPGSASVCRSCGSPLSDAVYTPLTPDSTAKPRRKKWPLVLILLVLLLAGGGFLGYQYYIHRVEKECLTFTKEFFSGLKALDLTNIEEKYQVKDMPIDPDLKGVIEEKIREVLIESPLSSVVDIDKLDIDYDILFDELTADANYEIVGTETRWNRCTVRVTTSNADFSKLPQRILDKARKDVSDLADPENVTSILSDLLQDYISPSEEDDSSRSGDDAAETFTPSKVVSNFTELLQKWYRDVKNDAPKKTTTADIEFVFKDGKWTIGSFDRELIYSFYGVPSDIME